MTTKWISQIFSGGASTVTPPTNPAPDNLTPAVEAREAENAARQAQDTSAPSEGIDLNKSVVLLLYGKNSFGDQIYSYLKITLAGIEKLKAAVLVGIAFSPSDFGTVIAAGKGEPTDEVKGEIASQYYVLSTQPQDEAPPPAAPIADKKGWDEY